MSLELDLKIILASIEPGSEAGVGWLVWQPCERRKEREVNKGKVRV